MKIFDKFRKKKGDEILAGIRPESLTTRQGRPLPELWQVGDKLKNRYGVHDVKEGGMGIVYVCYDYKSGLPIALKTFQDKYLTDHAFIERFKYEAEVWVRLGRHRNIVRAEYLEDIEGRLYIVLEYVAGDEQCGADLSGWIKRGRITLPLSLNFGIQFCYGMIHAHSELEKAGIRFVHQDIKPSNIMVTRDKVIKVTDFGLVKAFAKFPEDISPATFEDRPLGKLGLSKSGAICGTLPYMSPEQCRGEKDIDVRSDIYSFGCVMHEMLTRRYIFNVLTPDQFIYHHLNTAPKSPRVHKKLDAMILKCLNKNPDRRYQDFEELERDLSQLYYDITGGTVQLPDSARLESWELINQGISLSVLGYYREAEECYRQALKLEPNDARAYYNLGITYRDQNNLDAAINEYVKALAINPNYLEAHFQLGGIYSLKDNSELAIGEFKEALRINPDDDGTHYMLGLVYLKQDKFNEAIAEFKEALRINPHDADFHHKLGMAYQGQGQFHMAIAEYREALTIDPNSSDFQQFLSSASAELEGTETIEENELPEEPTFDSIQAWNNQAIALANLGKYQESIACCDKVIEIDAENMGAWYNKGLSLENLGQLIEALECFERAIEFGSTFYHAWDGKARVLGKLEKHRESVDCCNRTLEINPVLAPTLITKGISLGKLGHHKEALECFDEALKINPRLHLAWNGKGMVLNKLGRLQEAVECYDKALDINPNEDFIWKYKGDSLNGLGRYQEAIQCYDKVLELNPQETDAWNSKGNALGYSGRDDEALACYDRALEINPNIDFIWCSKGASLGALGRFNEAIDCCDRALKINPHYAEVWSNKGLFLRALGRNQEAADSFRKFVEFAPGNYAAQVKEVKNIIRQLEEST